MGFKSLEKGEREGGRKRKGGERAGVMVKWQRAQVGKGSHFQGASVWTKTKRKRRKDKKARICE